MKGPFRTKNVLKGPFMTSLGRHFHVKVAAWRSVHEWVHAR